MMDKRQGIRDNVDDRNIPKHNNQTVNSGGNGQWTAVKAADNGDSTIDSDGSNRAI